MRAYFWLATVLFTPAFSFAAGPLEAVLSPADPSGPSLVLTECMNDGTVDHFMLAETRGAACDAPASEAGAVKRFSVVSIQPIANGHRYLGQQDGDIRTLEVLETAPAPSTGKPLSWRVTVTYDFIVNKYVGTPTRR